jgi:hypothetical protein
MTREDRDSQSCWRKRLTSLAARHGHQPYRTAPCLTFARCLMTRPLSGPGNTYAGMMRRTDGHLEAKSRRTRRRAPHVTGSRLPHSRWYRDARM